MAFCLMKSASQESMKSLSATLRLRSPEVIGTKTASCAQILLYSTKRMKKEDTIVTDEITDDVPTSAISRPISEILKELNKKVPDSLIRARTEANGFTIKHVPWWLVS